MAENKKEKRAKRTAAKPKAYTPKIQGKKPKKLEYTNLVLNETAVQEMAVPHSKHAQLMRPGKATQPILGKEETQQLHQPVIKRGLRMRGRTFRFAVDPVVPIDETFFRDEKNRTVHPA
jgi:hypothetical protein